jgi:hypothetical protein
VRGAVRAAVRWWKGRSKCKAAARGNSGETGEAGQTGEAVATIYVANRV